MVQWKMVTKKLGSFPILVAQNCLHLQLQGIWDLLWTLMAMCTDVTNTHVGKTLIHIKYIEAIKAFCHSGFVILEHKFEIFLWVTLWRLVFWKKSEIFLKEAKRKEDAIEKWLEWTILRSTNSTIHILFFPLLITFAFFHCECALCY